MKFEDMKPRVGGEITLEREACAYILDLEGLHEEYEEAKTEEERDGVLHAIYKAQMDAYHPFLQLLKKSGLLDETLKAYREEMAQEAD